MKRPHAVLVDVDAHVEPLAGLGEAPAVAWSIGKNGETWSRFRAVDAVPRRSSTWFVRREQVRQPLAERVVDLGDDAAELAVAPVAAPEGDRVEDVAEHAQVGQAEDRGRRRPSSIPFGEIRADVDVVAVVPA